MKKILKASIIAIAVVSGSVFAAAQQAAMKIGVVNLVTIYQQSPQGEGTYNDLKSKLQPAVDKLQGEQKALTQQIQDFNKNSPTMSKTDVTSKQKEFAKKQQEFQARVMQLRQEEMQKEQSMAQVYQTQVTSAITQVGKAGSYDMILSNQAALYSKSTYDVTSQVVKIMQDSTTAKLKKSDSTTAKPKK